MHFPRPRELNRGDQFDESQPRVPKGHPDGGQWRRQDDARQPLLQPAAVPAYQPLAAALVRPPVPQLGRSLPSLGAGAPGAQLAEQLLRGLRYEEGFTLSPSLQYSIALYDEVTRHNGPDQHAVLIFKAEEFRSGKGMLIGDVRVLDRAEAKTICAELETVQSILDAAELHVSKELPNLSPAVHGTKVHVNVKYEVNGVNDEGEVLDPPQDPDFASELSYVKGREADATYGTKGSIRVDVYENTGNGTVCVYDIKTGKKGLGAKRVVEIATHVARAYPKVQKVIVLEVKPNEGPKTNK